MFVYARAKNTTASTGTGRREASVRILGKKGSLPMRIMNWTEEYENTRKKIPRTKLIMMKSNILWTLVCLMRRISMVDRRKVIGVGIRMIFIIGKGPQFLAK